MSRICYGDEDEYSGLWWGAVRSAVNGRRGQAVLREVEAALLALPARRLIESRGSDGGNVCVLGALDWHRQVRAGMPPGEALAKVAALAEDTLYSPDEAAGYLGLTRTLSFVLMEANDEIGWRLTPEERYQEVLRQVRRMIRDAPASPAPAD